MNVTEEPLKTSPWDVLEATFVAGATAPDNLPAPALAEVAFAGRSNVGKSSAMNMLLQRRGLVRTSSTPGLTRAVNLFHVKIRSGLELQMVDLPGYGFAKRSKGEKAQWGVLLESYLRARPTLRAVVVLVDVRRGPEQDDLGLVDFCALPREGAPPVTTIVAATKLDLVPKAKRKPALAAIGKLAERPVIGISAESAEGRVDLWRAIARAVLGPGA
jgi:GTP-binding protein